MHRSKMVFRCSITGSRLYNKQFMPQVSLGAFVDGALTKKRMVERLALSIIEVLNSPLFKGGPRDYARLLAQNLRTFI